MIKLVNDTIDKADISLLIEWLSQDEIPKLTKGDITVEFEKQFAKYIGTDYSIFVNSGSSAILLMLWTLKEAGKLKNNKIIVPALSWVTDVTSVIQTGLQPILCDCNLNDLSVDLDHLEKLFIEEKPSCLILVSVLGLVPDMERVIELCEKYEVFLLEDYCESLGSEYKSKKLGSFGIMGCTSTYFGHIMSTIEGGIITTDDKDLYEIAISLRSHGWDRDLSDETKREWRENWGISDFEALYTFYYNGFNFRSTDLQALLGLSQLNKLKEFVDKRYENFINYNLRIKHNDLNINTVGDTVISNFAFPIVNKDKELIIKDLIQNSIEVRPLIAGNMANKPFWKKQFEVPSLPNCELIDKYGFYIPNNHQLTFEEIKLITTIVNKYE